MLSQSRLDAEMSKIKSPSVLQFRGGHKRARANLFQHGLQQARRRPKFAKELILEFGVCSGTTITTIANLVGRQHVVFGFDSFEGLPARWRVGWPWGPQFKRKGAFNRKGRLPKVPSNVRLVKGWFDVTLKEFLATYKGEVAFVHVDSDLYQSAKTVLTLLATRITKGTVLQFDQFYNFEGMQDDSEIRAFLEFIDETGHQYEYLGRTLGQDGRQVSVLITN